MEFPSDIFDYILSFLRPHPESLIAFSKAHPVFSRIAERHRYYNTIIHTGATSFTYSFKPSSLIKLVLETPRIVNYVRVLQIEFHYRQALEGLPPYLEEVASILPKFPLLKCIKLTTRHCNLSWQDFPRNFRTAVGDCLHLPTLQMVHVGNIRFPLSLLDNHVNIDCLSLSGPPQTPNSPDTPCPQLKSLDCTGVTILILFTDWAKQHMAKLQSLKYDHSIEAKPFSLCSDTLTNLDLRLGRYISQSGLVIEILGPSTELNTSGYYTIHNLECGDIKPHERPVNLSSLPHLKHLTVRADVYFDYVDNQDRELVYCSSLPAAVEIIMTASSLQHLTLEISITFPMRNREEVDLSPLRVLAESSSLHRIDLYIRWYRGITHTEVTSWLASEGLMKLIEQGVLVIHTEETAPNFLDKYA